LPSTAILNANMSSVDRTGIDGLGVIILLP